MTVCLLSKIFFKLNSNWHESFKVRTAGLQDCRTAVLCMIWTVLSLAKKTQYWPFKCFTVQPQSFFTWPCLQLHQIYRGIRNKLHGIKSSMSHQHPFFFRLSIGMLRLELKQLINWKLIGNCFIIRLELSKHSMIIIWGKCVDIHTCE